MTPLESNVDTVLTVIWAIATSFVLLKFIHDEWSSLVKFWGKVSKLVRK